MPEHQSGTSNKRQRRKSPSKAAGHNPGKVCNQPGWHNGSVGWIEIIGNTDASL
jgi:hypothetical protein